MQLKMSRPFNIKLAKQTLQEEDKYISDLFSKIPFPTSALVEPEYESEDDKQPVEKAKIFLSGDKKLKRAQTFEELHQKFDELKGKRKLDYKQKLLKKNLKNKLKKKSKREERLMQKKLARTEQLAAGSCKVKKEDVENHKVTKPKPIFNSEGNMVFSKFDFSEIGAKRVPPKNTKDPKRILQQLEKKKEKLKHLEEAGEKDKAVEIKEKEAWKSVLAKASGEKVKDDPELLKRSAKRQEQKKKHSSKKWESRIEKVQNDAQERQKKRHENITKRKRDKKTNKLKKASKKGRIIPGF